MSLMTNSLSDIYRTVIERDLCSITSVNNDSIDILSTFYRTFIGQSEENNV